MRVEVGEGAYPGDAHVCLIASLDIVPVCL